MAVKRRASMLSNRSVRRRSLAVVIGIAAVIGVLGVRLFDLQVVQADALQASATQARTVTVMLPGNRGEIVDASGNVLADSVMRYDAQVSPVNAIHTYAGTGPEVAQKNQIAMVKQANRIGAVTGQGGAAIVALITNALAKNPKSQYAPVVDNIDAGEYGRLLALNIPWLQFTSDSTRSYPYGAVGGNVVGFVGSSGQAQSGVELSDNACLAGTNGKQTYQIGADGTTLPGSTVTQKSAKDGGTLELTLNSDLQYFAQQQLAQQVPALGAKFGFVTVANAKTGAVVALAQYPSVDPNNVGATPNDYWSSLAFTTPFEPGSTFKALTAAALIDQGKATPTSQALVPYTFTDGKGANLHDAGYHAPERLTLTGILMLSSNVGISILSQNMSEDVRYDYYKKFGIGASTGIAFPGQSDGILNPVSQWDDQTKYATTFGQGVSATQMQMVGAYQALANGGVKVPLHLVAGCRQADGTLTDKPSEAGTRVVSQSTADQVVGMLQSVVSEGELAKQLSIPGYVIAAKTGTAQQPDGHGGYLPSYYVSVMGMVPASNPQYVVSVNIGYPTTITSSAAAAPLFNTIVTQVLNTFKIPPSSAGQANYPPYY